MSHESLNLRSEIGFLSIQLEEETMFMSGGFDRLDAFQQIISHGESALPELLDDMDNPNWWRLQAIWTVAHNIGKSIEYPEEIRGKYAEVIEHTIGWAKANGYIAEKTTTD